MFTGLVEEVGTLKGITPAGPAMRLTIACRAVLGDARPGDSICVDGVCLTAERVDAGGFSAFASPETLAKTSLGERTSGDGLNLERSVTLQTRLGGHLVSGHVDETGVLRSARRVGESWEVHIAAPPAVLHRCVPKGSIAIDGISLTIVDLTDQDLSAWIIPETWSRTTLSHRQPGQKVNLEVDLVGKYVYRFLETREGITDKKAADERLKQLLDGWGAGRG